MSPEQLDNYLSELRRELRRRGFFGSRILEEVRGHVLDAAEAEARLGTPSDQAMDHALQRIGPARAIAAGFASQRDLIMERILFVVAVTMGVMLAWVDSRPTWDDTGVTAGALLLITMVLGALAPRRPWLWALSLGLWIPAFGIYGSSNYGSLISLAVAFAGAYGGMMLRRVFIPA